MHARSTSARRLVEQVPRITLLLALVVSSSLFCSAKIRHYYIAAEDVTWDYAPSGMDLLHDRAIPPPWGKQTRWSKSRFIEYTDSTFSVRKPQPEWLGILGPVIRGEVGDEIVVEFLNRGRFWHSMHPHGLRYDKANEGSMYLPVGGPGSSVPPGARFTYHWFADEGSGPGKNDPSSIVWWYHGHVDDPVETNAGLLGPIIITAKGQANADGNPKGVDHEFVTLFMVFDELAGKDAGLFHSINGYIFGNLPGLTMKNGEHVRWYLLGMGNERDLHSPHWHGKTVQYQSRHTDVVELLPGSMAVADMVADNPGTWMFHCHVADHMESGMMAIYTISAPAPCDSPLQFSSAEFWHTDKYHVTVKNNGTKSIKKLLVDFDYLLGPGFRSRPFNHEWVWNASIAPGQEQTFEMPGGTSKNEDGAYAWILYPKVVIFEDGTRWQPKEDGGCFSPFWRDKEHPSMDVLPTLQLETKED
jgi:manganese oxidase